ncbi:MAG: type II secretion system protein GspC [Enterobacterales bacterium]|nr:type II secretion system protein GspC [Enterobacterales bacterium]
MKLSTDNLIAWGKNYSNWLPVIQWTGWFTLCLILAKLFWALTMHFTAASPSLQLGPIKQVSQSKSTTAINVKPLIEKHLFGSSDQPMSVVVEDVVERVTQLNLKLRGIYAASNPSRSNSIIEDGKGKQAVYFIGDSLNVSGRVFLRQVYRDRVILETNGVKEVLKLKDDIPGVRSPLSSIQSKLSKKIRKVQDKRKNQMITRSLSKYKKQLKENPVSLVGIVNYRPKLENGEMIGIEISPGKDKRLFTQLGLRRKDVITAINGVALDNIQNAMNLLSDIGNMRELQVDIKRENESVNLLVNLDEK